VIAEFDKLLNIAKEAALVGANILKDSDSSLKETQYNGLHDVQLKADEVAEKNIVSYLSSETDIDIISEEMWKASPNKVFKDSSDLLWVVDPLDGSYNFLYNIPFYCISIALWQGRESPILGVIYNFYTNELFSGIVGKGSWINNIKIQTTDTKDIGKAILCTGFPVNIDYSTENLTKYIYKIRDWGKIRLFGSAGLSLAYVASGRVDAYQEEDIMFWDVAAGISLVRAAGGMVDFMFSDERDLKMNVVATNNHLRIEDKIEEGKLGSQT